MYENLPNYFIIQLWHVLHNKYRITYFGCDNIRDRRINICDKVCGYIFVLAFCILMIFCLQIWKPTPLNHPRDTTGETPTTPLPLGVLALNLVIGLYYR